MSKKILTVLIVVSLIFAVSGDISARALARWIGPIAYAGAHTRVIGEPFCDDVVVYPFDTQILPISAYCLSVRTPVTNGGAVAFAFCDEPIAGLKVAGSVSFAWGVLAWAGKSVSDTTRCSTYVESSVDGGFLTIDLFGSLHSIDYKQGAIMRLDVTAEGDTLFSGRVEARGSPDSLKATGDFILGDFIVVGSDVEINKILDPINVTAYHPDSIQVEITADARSYMRVPSTTPYGMILLIGLLALAATFFIYRKYRVVT